MRKIDHNDFTVSCRFNYKGEIKEIAALVLELQERQKETHIINNVSFAPEDSSGKRDRHIAPELKPMQATPSTPYRGRKSLSV